MHSAELPNKGKANKKQVSHIPFKNILFIKGL